MEKFVTNHQRLSEETKKKCKKCDSQNLSVPFPNVVVCQHMSDLKHFPKKQIYFTR